MTAGRPRARKPPRASPAARRELRELRRRLAAWADQGPTAQTVVPPADTSAWREVYHYLAQRRPLPDALDLDAFAIPMA